MKRLGEMGDVAIEMVACGDPLQQVLADGIRLEGAAWKGRRGTAIKSDPAVQKFYETVAARFSEQGWLKLHFLKLGTRRIAFQYAVAYKDRVYSLKPGFDPEYAQCSPSSLLFFLFLEELFRSGMSEYDLLGVQEEWKMQWAQETRAHYWLFVFSGAVLPSLVYWLKFRCMPMLRGKTDLRLQQVLALLKEHLSLPGASA